MRLVAPVAEILLVVVELVVIVMRPKRAKSQYIGEET